MDLHIHVQFQMGRKPTQSELDEIKKDIERAINKHDNLVVGSVNIEFK